MKRLFLFLFFTLFIVGLQKAFAQKQYNVGGTIKDAKNGESLIGAVVFLKDDPKTGVNTNAYGFFSLKLPSGKQTIVVRFVGYEEREIAFELTKDTTITVRMGESAVALNEVTIKATKQNQNITQTTMGVEKLSIEEIQAIPVLMGEKDVLKTIQLLPGVKSAGDGNSGFYVRGGGADQNLILLDEAPVYNASHLLGFFSTFNSDAIKDLTLYKGGMPAEYGGRLASVLDIKMKDGNDKEFSGTGGIGLLTSRLTLEGPIVKEKGSFIASGRFMYAGLFAKLSKDPNIKNTTLYFYDVNLKANYQVTNKDRVFLSGYFGRDNFSFNRSSFGIDWGNITATARWNHIFTDKLFSNTSLIFSNYDYTVSFGTDSTKTDIKSSIRDVQMKEDLQYYLNSTNTMKFGFDMIYHKFVPGKITASDSSFFTNLTVQNKQALETAFYISNEQTVATWLKIQYGVRLSLFTTLGAVTTYDFNSDGIPVDSTHYGPAKAIKTYINPEPRFAANFIINQQNSVKFSYNRNAQYLHQLSNSTSTSPTDVWIPTTQIIKPEIADQLAIGYFGNFFGGKIQPSIEGYYKWMQNSIDYKNGANILLNNYVESQLAFGKGYSYGIEFLTKFNFGKVSGWAAYTWSRVQKQIDGIDNGTPFYAKQDRTHEVSLVGMYKINKKWEISAVWVYYTGNAVTFPNGKYDIDGKTVPYYTNRNGYRMPAYHRLDIGATVQLKKHKKWGHNLNLSVYNTYGRANAFSINFQQDPDDATKTQAVQVSLFKVVPSVTYNFNF